MKKYPKDVVEALDRSIEKWFNITFKGATDNAGTDCPLCHIFLYLHDCSGCPIHEHTGANGCRNTPYEMWTNQTARKVIDATTALLAYDFYTWLKDLRDQIEVEVEDKFEPFTITIKTLEEAQELWHRLNMSRSGLEKCIDPVMPHSQGDHTMRLWRTVDNVLNPWKTGTKEDKSC